MDSFTQLVINSSNFYARFLSFSREYDASGKRFREAEGEASPQSPPAGALLLKKKKKEKKKKKRRKEKKEEKRKRREKKKEEKDI